MPLLLRRRALLYVLFGSSIFPVGLLGAQEREGLCVRVSAKDLASLEQHPLFGKDCEEASCALLALQNITGVPLSEAALQFADSIQHAQTIHHRSATGRNLYALLNYLYARNIWQQDFPAEFIQPTPFENLEMLLESFTADHSGTYAYLVFDRNQLASIYKGQISPTSAQLRGEVQATSLFRRFGPAETSVAILRIPVNLQVAFQSYRRHPQLFSNPEHYFRRDPQRATPIRPSVQVIQELVDRGIWKQTHPIEEISADRSRGENFAPLLDKMIRDTSGEYAYILFGYRQVRLLYRGQVHPLTMISILEGHRGSEAPKVTSAELEAVLLSGEKGIRQPYALRVPVQAIQNFKTFRERPQSLWRDVGHYARGH